MPPDGAVFCLLVVMAASFLTVPGGHAGGAASGRSGDDASVEGLFGHKSGADKKNTAITLVQNTIG